MPRCNHILGQTPCCWCYLHHRTFFLGVRLFGMAVKGRTTSAVPASIIILHTCLKGNVWAPSKCQDCATSHSTGVEIVLRVSSRPKFEGQRFFLQSKKIPKGAQDAGDSAYLIRQMVQTPAYSQWNLGFFHIYTPIVVPATLYIFEAWRSPAQSIAPKRPNHGQNERSW